jgi:hypothetical protein
MANPIIEIITSKNSESAARVIINNNFKALRAGIIEVSQISIFEIGGLNIEGPLTPGVAYSLVYNSNNTFNLEPAFNNGIRFVIPADNELLIPVNNQYIVNNYFYADGIVTVDGELVIL